MTDEIIEEAKRQIAEEKFKAAVAAEKVRLLTSHPWWHKFLPFTIEIKRRK